MATKNIIIQQAKAHYSAIPIKETIVPEWGDEDGPLTIYSSAFTLAEKMSINAQAKGDEQAACAYVIIRKAMDANGQKIFTVADKHALMNMVDVNVLVKIAYSITNAPTMEDMAKK